MVGFYGGAPLEYAGITEQGSDAVPSSTGEVLGSAFGEGLAQNITPRAFRSAGRFAAETGVLAVDEYGRPIMGEPEPTISPESANAEYGIKGHLSFDKPVPRSVAQDLRDHKQEQIEREDTIARRESSLLTGGAARFSANLMAGALDPINLAAGFIPVLGEAREAALIAQAASASGRFGIRAGLGGAQGAAGMAALQPLEFGLSRQEHEDYTMADALRSIALGTVLGGGLHAGIGAAVDRATGRYRNPLSQRLEDAGPEARETLLQGALAQSIEGRPVDVAPALDAFDAARAEGESTTLYRAGGPTARYGREQDPTFFSTAPEGAAPYATHGETVAPYEIKLGRVFDVANGEDSRLYRQFLEETDNPGRYGKNGNPLWTTAPDLADWLRSKGIAFDAIKFDENTGHPSIAVYPKVPGYGAGESITEIFDAARRPPEGAALATQEAAEIQARAPEPPPEIADQIAEAQRHVDALMNELQPEAAREPIPGEAAKTNPAPENKGADIPELRQADEMVARAEGDARAYEAAANCIAEKGL